MTHIPPINHALFAAFLGVFFTLQQPATAFDLYVSPSGSDSASGFNADASGGPENGPLASPAAATARIRKLRAEGIKDQISVYFREGVYRITEPWTLTPEDSGTLDFPSTYRAYRGDRPVISGGVVVTGWTKDEQGRFVASAKGLPPFRQLFVNFVASAKGLPPFRQLFVNGERRVRARTPNAGFLQLEGRLVEEMNDTRNNRGFKFREGDIKDWADPAAEIIGIHSWETSRLTIAKIDPAARTVDFNGSAHWPFTQWEADQNYYIENIAEALDAPGEWRLDAASQTITYIPMPGEEPGSIEAVVPVVDRLLVLKGDPENGKRVEYVNFDELSFEHSEYPMPELGISDAQAATSAHGAVEIGGARQITITNCAVRHVGTYALRVLKGSSHILIEGNHFHDLGAGGVGIGEKKIAETDAERTSLITLRNNFIHDGGHVWESGVGVWIGQSSDNVVEHNEIADFGYTGVSVGWTWGYAESGAHRNLIERNHIHHIGRGILSDMGGIYTLGNSPGSALRNNHIHHVVGRKYGGWGVYTDEGTTNMLIENNVVHHCNTGTFHQHYGKENLLRNNVFAFSPVGQIIRSREEEHRSFRFERNIVLFAEGDLLGSKWGGPGFSLDGNCYWRTDGAPLLFDGKNLTEWRRATGNDHRSIVADPGFVDPKAGDWRLRDDGAARLIGFAEIDLRDTGLTGKRSWRELPAQYPVADQAFWTGHP